MAKLINIPNLTKSYNWKAQFHTSGKTCNKPIVLENSYYSGTGEGEAIAKSEYHRMKAYGG
jgi:hypothetical protein